MTTHKVRENQWGNWYGYRGRRRVMEFANTSEFTAEQNAYRWLFVEQMKERCAEIGTTAPGTPRPDYEALADEVLNGLAAYRHDKYLIQQDRDYLARMFQACAERERE